MLVDMLLGKQYEKTKLNLGIATNLKIISGVGEEKGSVTETLEGWDEKQKFVEVGDWECSNTMEEEFKWATCGQWKISLNLKHLYLWQ